MQSSFRDMAMQDDDLFSQLIGDDVKPIRIEKRVTVDRRGDEGVDKDPRRNAAEEATKKEDPLSSEPKEMVDPLAVLSFRKPGVQHGVFRNLRLGKYLLDARLDLHRMKVEQARVAVYEFVKDCVTHDIRAALITHGKGAGRVTPALLKSCVAHWLPQFDEVLAFHTAQKQHGSYGATYVLLRKSENKRQETREKHCSR